MTGNRQEVINWLLCREDAVYDIEEHKEKRSLNANSYAWALINQIANAVRASKDDVYLLMLKRYGQNQVVSIVREANIEGYFKYSEKIGESYLQGKIFCHYRIYKGSSEYNTHEMSILIDGIVDEAKNLGIETLPPYKLEALKEKWNR